MSYLKTLIQMILAIPKIWSIISQIKQGLDQLNEQKHDKALNDLKNSKTDKEQEDATRNLANHL